MDYREANKENLAVIDKDAQIHVVVNSPGDEEDVIDLGKVLHNMLKKGRTYIWVLLLCVAVGVCAALLHYQFTKPYLTVSSVVTLNYTMEDGDKVSDLTAPDGTALDLNQITSSYVLQNAMEGLELSAPVSLANLRGNIRIDRILTEDSRRQQEVASNMIEDKNNQAYTQVQGIDLTYVNRFVVSLTNGFGEEDSRVKVELTDTELRVLLDRILDAYNDYLVLTYADVTVPDDEISIIDVDKLDVLESLDLLRSAMTNLTEFVEEKPDAVRKYRSWRTGLSLNDMLEKMEMIRVNNVDYLYSYVYTNSIVVDQQMMLVNYQYDLREVQKQLDVVNDNILTNSEILSNYVNDEIFVSMQESDTAKSTRTTTDYYNTLISQQADNYARAAELETRKADLQDKIDSLAKEVNTTDVEQARAELDTAIGLMKTLYGEINAQFEEIMSAPTFNIYAEHSVAQGKSRNFLAASAKKMILGAAAGIVIACGLWFCSALAPELLGNRDEKKKAAAEEKKAAGKEAEKK